MRTRGEDEVRAFFESAVSEGDPSLRGVDPQLGACRQDARRAVGQIAKTILLLSDETAIVVVISGDRRVDMKKVRALGYGKRVRLAGPDDVVAHTGFAVGAVSPVRCPTGPDLPRPLPAPVRHDLPRRRGDEQHVRDLP